ncbi:MAG: hypothetical protein RIS55_753, partial [Actinomycetota bacterium]
SLGLQPVFNDHGTNSHARTSTLKPCGNRERERIGTARTRNQNQVAGPYASLIERLTHSTTHIGNRRGQPGTGWHAPPFAKLSFRQLYLGAPWHTT